MVILNKKRFLFIFLCLVVSISLASVNVKNNTVETVALPVQNKVIIIDARTWRTGFSGLLVIRE